MILLTGATGIIGRKLIDLLYQQGRKLRVLSLPNDPQVSWIEQQKKAEVVFGDITQPETLNNIWDQIDTVFHLAAVIISTHQPQLYQKVNLQGTRNLIDKARVHRVEHFIYISSASVYYPRSNLYAVSKKVAEQVVKESGLNYTIVRPTLVYGPEGGEEFYHFVNYLKRFPIIPFIGAGRALKAPIYVDDLVTALAAIPYNKITVSYTHLTLPTN